MHLIFKNAILDMVRHYRGVFFKNKPIEEAQGIQIGKYEKEQSREEWKSPQAS